MPRTFEGQAQPAELHDKATPQLKGYRLASHTSAFQRCLFSKDKVCNRLADPAGPPGGGSRPWAILPRPSERSNVSIPNRRPGGGDEYEKVFDR